MTKEEKNVSMQNNSTHTSTPNCESVEILFGLTPYQIYKCFGGFFDLNRLCSVALMEMLESIQRLNKQGEDVSIYISLTEAVATLVEIDRMHEAYSDFSNCVSYSCDDPAWLTDELLNQECVRAMHYHFLTIVKSVDKIGFMAFSTNVASSLSEITTKQAYEDMVYALACVYNLYVAYVKSEYSMRVNNPSF